MVMTIVPASALRDPARADTRCGCIAAVNAMPEMVESNIQHYGHLAPGYQQEAAEAIGRKR